MKTKKFKNFTSQVFNHENCVTYSVDNLNERDYNTLLHYCYENYNSVNQNHVNAYYFSDKINGYILCK